MTDSNDPPHGRDRIIYRAIRDGMANGEGPNSIALLVGEALDRTAPPADDVVEQRWMPHIGQKVRATKHCPDAELWNRIDMYVTGVSLSRRGEYFGPDYDVAISATWPKITDPTDGFMIGHASKPDELEPSPLTSLASMGEGT